jgi:hypothetical protein
MTEHIKEVILYNETQIELISNLEIIVIIKPEERELEREIDPFTPDRRELISIEMTPEIREIEEQKYDIIRSNVLAPIIFKILGIPKNPPKKQKVLNTILLGERGTGKSTWIRRMIGFPYSQKYFQTINPEPSLVHTTNDCFFNIRDFGGDLSKINQTFFEYANVAVIFYDICSRITFNKVPEWINMVKAISPDCYIIICANMEDKLRISRLNCRPPDACFNRFYEHNGEKYVQFRMSGKTLYNYEFIFKDAFAYCTRSGLLKSDRNFRVDLY